MKAQTPWILTVVAAALMAAGCATTAPPSPEDDFTEHVRRVWSMQSACLASWEELLDEWERNGGGLKATLRETRQQVAADRDSRFAGLVRAAWARQATALPAPGALEPLPAARAGDINAAIAAAAEGVVRAGCEPPIYLDNGWNRSLMAHRPADMPASVPDDLWPQRRWVQQWLFVRIEGQQ